MAVTAVDPSIATIRQRWIARAVRARAEALPFRHGSFAAALAVLTLYHWTAAEIGLSELRRVAACRVVILTFDPAYSKRSWLASEYLPG